MSLYTECSNPRCTYGGRNLGWCPECGEKLSLTGEAKELLHDEPEPECDEDDYEDEE